MLERLQRLFYFNPRSREGSDIRHCSKRITKGISIHAPAKGATKSQIDQLAQWTFQSTLPRRERHLLKNFKVEIQDFNPRSREGSDCLPGFPDQIL